MPLNVSAIGLTPPGSPRPTFEQMSHFGPREMLFLAHASGWYRRSDMIPEERRPIKAVNEQRTGLNERPVLFESLH